MIQYETKRLMLRTIDETESGMLRDYFERNRKFLEEWEAVREHDFYEEESIRKMIADENAANEAKTALGLYLFPQGENKIIGSVRISNIVYGAFLSCFLGYKLDEAYINQGLMTEALEKMIKIAFEEYHLHRLEANIMPKNIRSQRVVTKLGFEQEGLAKNYLKINGAWEDHYHYVLFNPLS